MKKFTFTKDNKRNLIITMIICILFASNLYTLNKNNQYRKYLSLLINTTTEYDKELTTINNYVRSLQDRVISECKK